MLRREFEALAGKRAACPGRAPIRCLGLLAVLSLNITRPGVPSRRGQPRTGRGQGQELRNRLNLLDDLNTATLALFPVAIGWLTIGSDLRELAVMARRTGRTFVPSRAWWTFLASIASGAREPPTASPGAPGDRTKGEVTGDNDNTSALAPISAQARIAALPPISTPASISAVGMRRGNRGVGNLASVPSDASISALPPISTPAPIATIGIDIDAEDGIFGVNHQDTTAVPGLSGSATGTG